MTDSPPRPNTLQELKSHLWDAANTLRGSAVDRTDWKGYILPLLFFKRICDVWDEEAAEAVGAGGLTHNRSSVNFRPPLMFPCILTVGRSIQ